MTTEWGEAPGFDISRLRGAAELARQDAERSEWLAKRARYPDPQDDPTFCACGERLSPLARGDLCPRCVNREAMRRKRRSKLVGPATDWNKPKMIACERCGCQTRKRSPSGNRRKFCDACFPLVRVEIAAKASKAFQAKHMQNQEAA